MNKKGFTLTELLAVILILAVILTIGIFSFNAIKNNTLDKQYESLVLDIKNAAKRYGNDKNIDIVYVQTLIDHGAISSENGVVTNPKDGSKLNCYYVDLNNDSFNASNDCSKRVYDGQVEIKDCTNGTCINLNDYYGQGYSNIKLLGQSLKSSITSYTWTSTNNPGELINNKEYNIKVQSNICKEINISLTANEDENTIHQREEQIKIDTLNPVIRPITTRLENGNIKLTTTLLDDCSGLKKYIIKKNDITIQETNIDGTNKVIDYITNESGKYEIMVYDLANNYSSQTIKLHSIKYNLNGGTNYSSAPTMYQEGVSVTIDGKPTKTNAKFMGWSRPGYSTKFYSFEIDEYATSDFTFDANWCSCTSPTNGNCVANVPSEGICNVTYSCNKGYTLTSANTCKETYPISLSVNVNNADKWTQSKTININYKNINKYAVVKMSIPCSNSSIKWNTVTQSSTSNTATYIVSTELSEAGMNYKICAQNSYGLTAETTINVKKIDRTPPVFKSVSDYLLERFVEETEEGSHFYNKGSNCSLDKKTISKTVSCNDSKCTINWKVPRCTGTLFFIEMDTIQKNITYTDSLSGLNQFIYLRKEEYLNYDSTPYTDTETPCLTVTDASGCRFRYLFEATDNAANYTYFTIDYDIIYDN